MPCQSAIVAIEFLKFSQLNKYSMRLVYMTTKKTHKNQIEQTLFYAPVHCEY